MSIFQDVLEGTRIPNNNLLYLGLDPSHWPGQDRPVHYPVIRTERLPTEQLAQAIALWPEFTHVIFTSRSAVRHWWEIAPFWGEKTAFALGEGTAGELRARGVEPLVAPEATQEGVIALLKTWDLRRASLFFPHSKKARPALVEFLQESSVRYFSLPLYDTLFQRPEPVPRLEEFLKIIFTSPSTVEGFIRIFRAVPRHCELVPIGPVTRRALEIVLSNGTSREVPRRASSG